jgi:hypothetical protein
MQPVQLSLMPDPRPSPAAQIVERLPDNAIAIAVAVLAGVIAKTAAARMLEAADDE